MIASRAKRLVKFLRLIIEHKSHIIPMLKYHYTTPTTLYCYTTLFHHTPVLIILEMQGPPFKTTTTFYLSLQQVLTQKPDQVMYLKTFDSYQENMSYTFKLLCV